MTYPTAEPEHERAGSQGRLPLGPLVPRRAAEPAARARPTEMIPPMRVAKPPAASAPPAGPDEAPPAPWSREPDGAPIGHAGSAPFGTHSVRFEESAPTPAGALDDAGPADAAPTPADDASAGWPTAAPPSTDPIAAASPTAESGDAAAERDLDSESERPSWLEAVEAQDRTGLMAEAEGRLASLEPTRREGAAAGAEPRLAELWDEEEEYSSWTEPDEESLPLLAGSLPEPVDTWPPQGGVFSGSTAPADGEAGRSRPPSPRAADRRAEDVALRLERIARSLREKGAVGPLAEYGADPLGALVAGYLLGAAEGDTQVPGDQE